MASHSADVAPSPVLAGYALAIGGTALFSSKAIFVKLAYAHGMPAEALLALRMLVALPIYLAILATLLMRSARARAMLAWRTLLPAALVGLLGYYVASYLDFLGLVYVSAQYERLVLFTYPFFVLALGALFFGVRFTWRVVPGMALSYLGIAVLFAWNLVTEPEGLWLGTALVLASALAFAFYQLLARQQMRQLSPMLFTCVGMSAAAVAAIVHNAAIGGTAALAAIDGTGLMLGLGLGIIGTVLPSFLMNAGMARIGARATSATGALGPVLTAGFAVLVLGEAFTVFHAAGTALVVVGAVWFARAEERAKAAAAAGVEA